jgi:RNA polymerase sigma-70 factor (ECF subfamily)
MENKDNLTEKAKRDFLLVKKALLGDQQAYAELMSFYRETVHYMLLKMVKNSYDAEDLTIEAFGKAFKNLDRYTEYFAFSTWLFKIAINNCIDFLRKKNNTPQYCDPESAILENDLIDILNPYKQENPEVLFMEKQKERIMRQAVQQLKPKYRVLIELRYFDELSYDEIAKKLNITLANVKILLFRAKDMLFHIMENMQYTI